MIESSTFHIEYFRRHKNSQLLFLNRAHLGGNSHTYQGKYVFNMLKLAGMLGMVYHVENSVVRC